MIKKTNSQLPLNRHCCENSRTQQWDRSAPWITETKNGDLRRMTGAVKLGLDGSSPRLALHHVRRAPLRLRFSRCEKRAQCPQIEGSFPESPLRDHWGNLQSLTLRIYNVSNHQAIPDGFCHLCLNKIRGKRAWHRERQILYDITYMWNLKKMIQMNLFTRTETDSQT